MTSCKMVFRKFLKNEQSYSKNTGNKLLLFFEDLKLFSWTFLSITNILARIWNRAALASVFWPDTKNLSSFLAGQHAESFCKTQYLCWLFLKKNFSVKLLLPKCVFTENLSVTSCNSQNIINLMEFFLK